MVGHLVSIQSEDLHPGVGQRSHLSAETSHVERCGEQTENRQNFFIMRDSLFTRVTAFCLLLSCQNTVNTKPVQRALISHHVPCAHT